MNEIKRLEKKLRSLKNDRYSEDLDALRKQVDSVTKEEKSEQKRGTVEYVYETSSESTNDGENRCEPEEDCDYSQVDQVALARRARTKASFFNRADNGIKSPHNFLVRNYEYNAQNVRPRLIQKRITYNDP